MLCTILELRGCKEHIKATKLTVAIRVQIFYQSASLLALRGVTILMTDNNDEKNTPRTSAGSIISSWTWCQN